MSSVPTPSPPLTKYTLPTFSHSGILNLWWLIISHSKQILMSPQSLTLVSQESLCRALGHPLHHSEPFTLLNCQSLACLSRNEWMGFMWSVMNPSSGRTLYRYTVRCQSACTASLRFVQINRGRRGLSLAVLFSSTYHCPKLQLLKYGLSPKKSQRLG